MANIYQVGKSWYYTFQIYGQQFRRSLKTKNTRDAEAHRERIDETIRLIENGILSPPTDKDELGNFIYSGGKITEKLTISKSQSLSVVVATYFEANDHKEESSTKTEKIHARHFERVIGDVAFNKIDVETLRAYAKKRQTERGRRGKKLSPETVKKEFQTWSLLWKFAVQQGIVKGESPHKAVQLKKPKAKEPFRTWAQIEDIIERGKLDPEQQKPYWETLFLDEGQVLKLLEHVCKNARHPFIYPAVAMAAFTGARRSEVMRSHIEDWSFEDNFVTVQGKKDSRDHSIVPRKVAIHPRLKPIIQSLFESRHPGGRFSFSLKNDIELTRNQAHDHFKRTLSGSKWEVVLGWHILRHSFCSNCARRNVPETMIDTWMGHHGNDDIKKRYRHLFPTDQHDYMGKIFA